MDNQQDDRVGGQRPFNKFVAGAVLGVAIIIGGIIVSGERMGVGPIAAPPDNAGATK